MKSRALILLGLLTAAAHAGPRTGGIYSVATDIADNGGQPVSSAVYTMDGSIGTVAGISSVDSPAEIAKAGYIGQLYNVVALEISAPAGSVDVDQTLQLGVTELLDDSTVILLSPGAVTWSVQSGPITAISGSGLVTAGVVYGDTGAVVGGSFAGFSDLLDLTVVNSAFDAWQLQYFGASNPLAAPGVDADGTGQTNLFKYIAGLDPTDPASIFTLTIAPVPGQSGQKNLIFSPIAAGRTYTVVAASSLVTGGSWSGINASAPADNGTQRTITDLSASGPAKFYEIQISYP